MEMSVVEFLKTGLTGIPYVVQFVLLIEVEGTPDSVTEVKSFLIPADSVDSARKAAQTMTDSLSESYRNSDGAVVNVQCLGIHDVNEVDHVDDDGCMELGSVQFSKSTSPPQLMKELREREDIPLLD